MSKRCTKCGADKPLDLFGIKTKAKDGRNTRCKDCESETARLWRLANPGKNKEAVARWQAQNRDRRAAYLESRRAESRAHQVEYHKKNIERIRARKAANYAANPAAWKEREAAWVVANPLGRAAKVRNYRARKMAASGSHTPDDVADLMQSQGGKCKACAGCLSADFHVDHVIALARGGGNGPDNLQLLCPTCNHRKGAKPMADFLRERGLQLAASRG